MKASEVAKILDLQIDHLQRVRNSLPERFGRDADVPVTVYIGPADGPFLAKNFGYNISVYSDEIRINFGYVGTE